MLAAEPAMKILVTGSHGVIGQALIEAHQGRGDRVVRLVRGPSHPSSPDPAWDPAAGRIDENRLEGFDAVVHLAGESLVAGRWTPARKARIRDSRVNGTRLLAGALGRLSRPPRVLVSASAIGYYGDRGDEIVREESPPGTGFLADVCRQWEAATEPARRAGIRVVHLRTGLVLSSAGGLLPRIVPVFRLGLGGRLGSGRQYMSWVAIEDVAGAVVHLLAREEVSGPVNLVAPHPVTNREFTAALGRVLSRPTPFPVPALALKLALGEMAGEIVASIRAEPARLMESGYAFQYPALHEALRARLGRTLPPAGRIHMID
jgi:uncharacterized protein